MIMRDRYTRTRRGSSLSRDQTGELEEDRRVRSLVLEPTYDALRRKLIGAGLHLALDALTKRRVRDDARNERALRSDGLAATRIEPEILEHRLDQPSELGRGSLCAIEVRRTRAADADERRARV